MMGGWAGTLLRVNLTRGEITKEAVNMDWAREYIGGRGLATRYLYAEGVATVDPLSPSNRLVLATGPLTGTGAPCGARYMVATKGPLTGAIAASNAGGQWPAELKFAGYDMVIFEGRAEKPVYLWISDDHAELRDAGHLWGKTTWETEDLLRAETDAEAKVAGIGPAGEKQVLFACVVNDKHRGAGRSGVGAVMGAKNLKAVAVRGTRGLKVADPVGFWRAALDALAKLKAAPVTGQALPTYGTEVVMNVVNEAGFLPARNFQQGQFEHADKIGGETLAATLLVRNRGCFACPIACGRVSRIPDPRYPDAAEGPEYEAAWALGADTGVSDLTAITKASFLCNQYSMDPISMGATLAAAMEMYERGILTDKETGRPLRFGDAKALVEMVEATGKRDGFGDELALGSKRLCEKYGHPEFFMGVKGQEFPAYDGRGAQGMGLNYATSNRGACHVRGYTISAEVFGIPEKVDPFTTHGKAGLDKLFQDVTAVVDSTGLCLFTTFAIGLPEIQALLETATRAGYTPQSLLAAGERIWNLERLFNLAAGLTAADDTLPRRILEEPIPAGPGTGNVNRLGEMLPQYYRLRGWDERGAPTPSKLAELGLASL